MTKDEMITCPKCGCDACYKTQINEVKSSYFCWGCGYQTNDLMKEGEFDFVGYEEILPELYKDVKHQDEEGRVWYPITINLEDKGTVFLNGKSADLVEWAGIKVTELTEEEKTQPKFKDKKYKSDAKSLKSFGNDFIEACDYVGMFEQN
jgi:hypothetical protein